MHKKGVYGLKISLVWALFIALPFVSTSLVYLALFFVLALPSDNTPSNTTYSIIQNSVQDDAQNDVHDNIKTTIYTSSYGSKMNNIANYGNITPSNK